MQCCLIKPYVTKQAYRISDSGAVKASAVLKIKELKMENLKKQIVAMIIDRCNLTDMDQDYSDYDAPIFMSGGDEGGFELDSVDALELVAGVKETFGVTVELSDKNVFYSVNTLADYISNHQE